MIGATGLVGSYILKSLLEKYYVVALVRHPLPKDIKSPYLTVKMGDVMKDDVLDDALKGIDIVVSAFAVPGQFQLEKPTTGWTDYTKKMIKFMDKYVRCLR